MKTKIYALLWKIAGWVWLNAAALATISNGQSLTLSSSQEPKQYCYDSTQNARILERLREGEMYRQRYESAAGKLAVLESPAPISTGVPPAAPKQEPKAVPIIRQIRTAAIIILTGLIALKAVPNG
ncbi:hypothetical protein F5984_18795 [Rudanella paleaurantiibacter]|uniref:Uncharacterized protein n=1 Tax=Rudanella paleaurantiibacter TaxID=2614655 RepID=A0A7J5TVV9_9BACT|nr:hypothetical protein [Rudanella paleaurantiibacter]KAB7728420.1 hypothetical protein F5984_18795 [Rudanella paleaurantiibacter]